MKIIFVIVCMLYGLGIYAQQEEIHWLTVGEAEKHYQEHPKPYLFDFYTDWCGWCKQMDKTTYSDPVVISFINRHFYPVRINAEMADTVYFRNKVYPPVQNGNKVYSGLALEMLKGRLSYPTTVFLYEPAKINLVVPGYIEIPKMQGFLVYFAESAWQSADINRFMEDFDHVFGAEASKALPEIDSTFWMDFKELEAARQQQKKKTLLFLKASWNNSSKMMERVVFTDSVVAAEVREHFYCLQLDVQSHDSLTFMTHRFVNAGPENSNLHQLAIALSDRNLKVPGVYLFDEEGILLERIYYYLDRDRGRLVLDYIGDDVFKSMSWADYLKMRAKESL